MLANFIRSYVLLANIYPRKNPGEDTRTLSTSLDLDSNEPSLGKPTVWLPADYSGEQEYYDQHVEEFGESDLAAREEYTPEIDPAEQIELGLETTRVTQVEQIRENVRRWEDIVSVLPFWRQALNPINVTFAVITVIALTLLLYLNFQALPQRVPLFYSQVNGSWDLFDKSALIVLPVFVGVIEAILIKLKRTLFDFDRRLSSVMAITQIFCNAILLVALLQIVSLMLI